MNEELKSSLRKHFKKLREELPESYQQAKSKQICEAIKHWDLYQKARSIAIYQAFKTEVDLSSLWQPLIAPDKTFYLPKIQENQSLVFLPLTNSTQFQTNRFGIAEPEVELSKAPVIDKLDLIFLPLVAFDNKGTRLGMGKGYYDRTLALCSKPLLVGVAYALQQASLLPREDWDVELDAVVTEDKIYWFNQ